MIVNGIRVGASVSIRSKEPNSVGHNGLTGTVVSIANDKYCVESDNGYCSWWRREELVMQQKSIRVNRV